MVGPGHMLVCYAMVCYSSVLVCMVCHTSVHVCMVCTHGLTTAVQPSILHATPAGLAGPYMYASIHDPDYAICELWPDI